MTRIRPSHFRDRFVGLVVGLAASNGMAAQPAQVQYRFAPKQSVIPVATPTIIPNPARPKQYFLAYNQPRSYGFGDFNGDGLFDIVVGSSYFDQLPERRVELWLNRGDGMFYDGTDAVLRGASIYVGFVGIVGVADFNEDGRPDVLLSDTGLEMVGVFDHGPQAGQHVSPGHRIGLLLSQPDGSLADASNRIVPNDQVFNHNSTVADLNNDGHLDFAVTRLGVPGLHEAGGTLIFYGDGKGGFTGTIRGLPAEIAYLSWPEMDFSKNLQISGSNAAVDLDGDGRTDLITASYGYADFVTKKRTIRFYQQQAGGTFVEKGRVEIPDALKDIGSSSDVKADENDGLGCASLITGDLNGDGRPDVVALWEGLGKSYIEILRNDGDFTFTDITLAAFGTYSTNRQRAWGNLSMSGYRLLDVNGDGTLDIVARSFGEEPADLASTSFIWLNDGTGRFSPWTPHGVSGPLTAAEITAATGGCDWCSLLPLVFDANGDDRPDVVLVDYQSFVTPDPLQTSAVRLTTMLSLGPAPFLVRHHLRH
jgi:FG-GAP-like repeat